MKIISEIIEITKKDDLSIESIESELKKNYQQFLRWAIVDISDKIYKVSLAYIR